MIRARRSVKAASDILSTALSAIIMVGMIPFLALIVAGAWLGSWIFAPMDDGSGDDDN